MTKKANVPDLVQLGGRWLKSRPENSAYLALAYEHFHRTTVWPVLADLQRQLAKQGSTIDLFFVADSLPPEIGGSPAQLDGRCQLAVLGVYLAASEAEELTDFIGLLQIAVEKYLGDQPPTVTSDELTRRLLLSPERLVKLKTLSEWEPFLAGGSSTPEGTWDRGISDSVRHFVKVQTFEDYIRIRTEFHANYSRAPWRSGLEQLFQRPSGTPMPRKQIFVIMPFRPSWSRAIYRCIRQSCSRFSRVDCVRADDIALAGRITDQILERIRSADELIADITKDNPNVMYELGFAHAAGKRPIILNQGTKAPFDLHDWRYIRYSVSDPDGLEEQLSAFLANSLGQRASRSTAAMRASLVKPGAVGSNSADFVLEGRGTHDDYWDRTIDLSEVDRLAFRVTPDKAGGLWRFGLKFAAQPRELGGWRYGPGVPLFHVGQEAKANGLNMSYYDLGAKGNHQQLSQTYRNGPVSLIIDRGPGTVISVQVLTNVGATLGVFQFDLASHRFARVFAWGDGGAYRLSVTAVFSSASDGSP